MENEPDREVVGRLLTDLVEPCKEQPNMGGCLLCLFEVDRLV